MRNANHPIDKMFIDRWSPRSFDPHHKISELQIEQLLEAARWSPSCFNEQPWRFIYELKPNSGFSNGLSLLVDKNAQWVAQASGLFFLFAKKTFAKNDSINDHSWFDCGSAWMSLALQARKMGLHSHAMAGIKKEEIIRHYNVDESSFDLICAIAIGKIESSNNDEKPNNREEISKWSEQGNFPK